MGDKMKNSVVKLNNVKNKVIAVWGTNGAGKSSFATQIAVLLSQDKNFNVLVLDFNTINPSLDHYLGISKDISNLPYNINDQQNSLNNTGLGFAYDAKKRGIFDSKLLKKIIITHPTMKNLHVLTGNYIFDLFEMFDEELFDSIIGEAKKNFDIIIIDTNSMFLVDATYSALKNADTILCLAEADFTSMRDINRSINYLTPYISKEKFKIVINKYTKKHIDKTSIKQTLEDHILMEIIDYNEKHVTSKLQKHPFVLNCTQKEKKTYLNVVERIFGM